MTEAELPAEITTERLLLRPMSREEALLSLAGGTPEGLLHGPGYPSEFAREVLDIFVGSRTGDATGFHPWYVIRRDEGDVIGDIGYSFPSGAQRPTVGYDIAEPLWGRGYATEALVGLLGYLLALPGVEAVEADTLENHSASRRVMEKAGMTHFDTRDAEVDGVPSTLVYYEVRRR